MAKRLRIFKSPWHTAHDHDIIETLAPFADFDLLINYTRRWDEKNRPLPENTRFVTKFEPGLYDFAILNIDQQCSNPNLNKSVLVKHMKQAIREAEPSLPVVFINHGTPVYPELYPDGTSENGFISETLREEIMNIVGDCPMIVNSRQAVDDWTTEGRPEPVCIHHGMDSSQWIDNPDKEPRSMTYVSQAGIGDKYYNRSFLIAVMDYLREKHGILHQWVNAPGCYSANGIKDYKEFLGKSLIYFNPTFASPMPRSRTEAMLSGACVITTPQHDADTFIENGVNGYIVPHDDVEYAGELIAMLIKDYKVAKHIGQQGKKTAEEIFNRDRYRKDWLDFINNHIL